LVEATTLRGLLRKDGCLTLPGVYDGISARVAASVGFDALYMTGYGVVASALGVADAGTKYDALERRYAAIQPSSRLEAGNAALDKPRDKNVR
jgi:2-methylisocitrate lyase-like PEP mutase family enzyme